MLFMPNHPVEFYGRILFHLVSTNFFWFSASSKFRKELFFKFPFKKFFSLVLFRCSQQSKIYNLKLRIILFKNWYEPWEWDSEDPFEKGLQKVVTLFQEKRNMFMSMELDGVSCIIIKTSPSTSLLVMFFDPGQVGSIFCGSGRVSHLWFGFEFGKFPLKT